MSRGLPVRSKQESQGWWPLTIRDMSSDYTDAYTKHILSEESVQSARSLGETEGNDFSIP